MRGSILPVLIILPLGAIQLSANQQIPPVQTGLLPPAKVGPSMPLDPVSLLSLIISLAGALKLVDHAVSDKGVIFASYEPAGDVQTGSFATKEPSEAELELREKIKAGDW